MIKYILWDGKIFHWTENQTICLRHEMNQLSKHDKCELRGTSEKSIFKCYYAKVKDCIFLTEDDKQNHPEYFI